mmetsp:Transcript_131488/g.366466  ORF Transcript_131488/g.366466 Transcript_131488/m.366466 type:complete len:212 (-) Transcript_131488:1133-1768(-)
MHGETQGSARHGNEVPVPEACEGERTVADEADQRRQGRFVEEIGPRVDEHVVAEPVLHLVPRHYVGAPGLLVESAGGHLPAREVVLFVLELELGGASQSGGKGTRLRRGEALILAARAQLPPHVEVVEDVAPGLLQTVKQVHPAQQQCEESPLHERPGGPVVVLHLPVLKATQGRPVLQEARFGLGRFERAHSSQAAGLQGLGKQVLLFRH